MYHVPEALFYLGRCAIKRGHDLTGTTRFREFVRRYPNAKTAPEALWQAAMAYERRGRHSDARKLFLTLAKTYPKSTYADQAAWRAGFALYQTRQYTAASKAFLRLSHQTTASHLRDQGYYWAGKCYQKLGQKAEAQFWIERASEGFPTSYYSTRAHAVLGKTENVHVEAPNRANTYPSANPIRLRRISQREIYWRLSGCIEMPSENTTAHGKFSDAIYLPWTI